MIGIEEDKKTMGRLYNEALQRNEERVSKDRNVEAIDLQVNYNDYLGVIHMGSGTRERT